MPNWLQNPHADFVLAAYAVAMLGLAGIGLVSWLTVRRINRLWRQQQKKSS